MPGTNRNTRARTFSSTQHPHHRTNQLVMFDQIHNALRTEACIETITPKRESPSEGLLYFTVTTDDTQTVELTYFQPENSTILVENGEIIEFDIRLGKWHPNDSDETMTQLRTAIRNAERQTCIYTSRVDSGGGAGFVPHVRGWDGPYPTGALIQFIRQLTTEVSFLQTHGTATSSSATPDTVA